MPLDETFNVTKILEPANMIWFKDHILKCINYCIFRVKLRFPNQENKNQLGIVGFKFKDPNN